MQCAKNACTVVLSFFSFSYYSLAILPASLCELEEPFIMLYHQGNDPSTC